MDSRGPVIDAILEDANTAPTLESFRRSMISRLSALIGLDSGAVHAAVPPPHGAEFGSVAFNTRPDLFDRFLRDQPRYFVSARPILNALDAGGGLGIDTDALGATARQRLAIYSEILIPSGVTCMLGSILAFRGATRGILVLCRNGSRGFRATDLARLRGMLPLLGALDTAVAARCRRESSLDRPRLGAREHEVARLLGAGLQNKEIAAMLGTSVHTVRNQVRRIYEKLGVSSRLQLAAKLRAAGDGQ
jgi:DNA-binding CsgD family transcriptional regulator